MNDETQFANFRCPIDWLEEIDKLVKEGLYQSRTQFIQEAIREKLYPGEMREQRKKQILHLIQQDPDIKKELGL